MSAPSICGVTAYLIAFSTSGWSSSDGRRACSAAGSIANLGRSRFSKRIFSISRYNLSVSTSCATVTCAVGSLPSV